MKRVFDICLGHLAQPLRALLDIVCFARLESDSIKALTQSMRIDGEPLMQTTPPNLASPATGLPTQAHGHSH